MQWQGQLVKKYDTLLKMNVLSLNLNNVNIEKCLLRYLFSQNSTHPLKKIDKNNRKNCFLRNKTT